MREVGIIVFPILQMRQLRHKEKGISSQDQRGWGQIGHACHSLTLDNLETSGSHLYIPISSLTGDAFASYITEKVHITYRLSYTFSLFVLWFLLVCLSNRNTF